MLFIQLVMTRTRDVACVDLTCICASGVSMVYVYSFQLVDKGYVKKKNRKMKRKKNNILLFHQKYITKYEKKGFTASG